MSSVLDAIQDVVRDAIAADSFFADAVAAGTVEVFSENEGDPDARIDEALARLGLYILVRIGKARCNNPNLRGVVLDRIEIPVECGENVLLNRAEGGSGITALEAAERVLTICHFQLAVAGKAIVAAEDAIAPAIPPRGASCAYNAGLRTQDGIKLSEQQT